MTPSRAARRLAHDVGKYVARTARNLPPGGPPDAELVAMLARDLYELGAERRRASALLAELAAPLVGQKLNDMSFRNQNPVEQQGAAAPSSAKKLNDMSFSDPRARVEAARALLAEADGLEARLRAGEAQAVARGAAIALEVEQILRALARETP